MQSILQFLSEVKVELLRVEWPSKKEWFGATAVTFFSCFTCVGLFWPC